ncbi:hypothetical protein EDB19DRAFT_1913723 [Suillus lakei]|nr:hypothetical protein EDB19DRAFT_1913723 [Suillus lakei]
MAGTVWTTPEQKEFLEMHYSGFLLVQLQAKVSQYWDPIYLEWFKRWPEEDVVFKNTPASDPHTDEENKVLGAALQKQRQEEVKEQAQDTFKSSKLMTKQEKLSAIRKLSCKAYKAAPPEVQALCEEKECTAPIAQSLQVIKDMTGWEWTVIGAGPDPHLGGQLNAMSYHTGVNGDGHNWKQATLKFIEKHLNPYLELVGTLFHEKSHVMDVVTPLTNSLSPTTSLANGLPPTISSPLGEGSGSLKGASLTMTPASHGTALHTSLTLSDTL